MDIDRTTLARGLSNAAWGYLLIHFDINLNAVSILPSFVGYVLLLHAIRDLSAARRDLALLRPLCILLVGWNAVDWGLAWLGGDVHGWFPPLDLIVTVTVLYFHFQFLTDITVLAEQCQPQGYGLDRRLRRRRTAYVVLTTAADITLFLPAGRFAQERTYVLLGLTVVLCGAAFFVMLGLFELRRGVKKGQDGWLEA